MVKGGENSWASCILCLATVWVVGGGKGRGAPGEKKVAVTFFFFLAALLFGAGNDREVFGMMEGATARAARPAPRLAGWRT